MIRVYQVSTSGLPANTTSPPPPRHTHIHPQFFSLPITVPASKYATIQQANCPIRRSIIQPHKQTNKKTREGQEILNVFNIYFQPKLSHF